MYTPPSAKSTNFLLPSTNTSVVNQNIDPFYDQVKLQLNCSGNLLDDKGHLFTMVGSFPPKINLGKSRDGKGCLDLTGDNSQIGSTYYYTTGNDFLLLDNIDGCIEFWANFSVNPGIADIVSNQGNNGWYNWVICSDAYNNLVLKVGNSTGNSQLVISGIAIPSLNSWNHYAFVKSGKTWSAYLNGVLMKSLPYTMIMGYVLSYQTPLPSNVVLNMKFDGTTISDETGKVITASGSPQLSTSIYKYGSASLFLNGGYISTTSMGIAINQDFTMEFWVYPLSLSGNRALIEGVGTRTGLIFLSGGTVYWLGEDISSTGVLTVSTWNHVAVSRASNVLKIFLNGTQVGSGTSTQAQDLNSIGNDMYAQLLSGYFDDIRITKGLAKYSSNFYPTELSSNAPAGTNYYLNLGKPTNTGIPPYTTLSLKMEGSDGSTTFSDDTGKSISVAGNTVIRTTKYKYGSSSAYFDGAGDYLYADNKGISAFGTSDFTIEAWVYFLSYGSGGTGDYAGTIFDSRTNGGDGGGMLLITTTSGTLRLWNIATGSIVLPLNTWVHITASRTGGYMRTFINGVKDIEIANSTNFTGDMVTIGSVVDGRANNTYLKHYGYIDNIFVLNGTGKYSTSFTPTEPVYINKALVYLDDVRITIGEKRYSSNFSLSNSINYVFSKSGIVYNSLGLPCKKLVRLYRRSDGSLVNESYSDSVTGEWTMKTPYDDPHFIVVFDDTGGQYNSLLLDRV